MSKKMFEVGINDADYPTRRYKTYTDRFGRKKQRVLWRCPFYRKWTDMLKRCYSKSYQKRQPTYVKCSVCEEWLTFSNFKVWMEQQDWENKELDKDILLSGNISYSPKACVFTDHGLNMFLNSNKKARGKYKIGVSCRKGRFISQCNNPFTDSKHSDHLGSFDTEEEAHLAWKAKKHEHACKLADLQDDERVADALRIKFL